jgi:hypothetical protein
MRAVKKRGRMAVGRRGGRRRAATLNCPKCARAFLIAPGFVMEVAATGRIEPSGRAEVRVGICGHTWWSKHAEALRKARRA